MTAGTIPDWVVYPDVDWKTIGPEEAGLDVRKFNDFISGLKVQGANFGGENHEDNRWGGVLTRGGYLLHSWGDKNFQFHTASVGKAFLWVLFGLAVEKGMVQPDDFIWRTWTGEGQLSDPHKYLNRDFHRKLTWRHLLGSKDESKHYGGFPVEFGHIWRAGRIPFNPDDEPDRTMRWARALPEWARWTGDPSFDNYSHIEPGTMGQYSSGGYWRLAQALTALWNDDLKNVLNQGLMKKIGVPEDRWNWPAGKVMTEQKYFYPAMPDAYTYLDPPYEINGHPVRSGPGWVTICASDLARFGHLIATRGRWKGEQILTDPHWLRGHSGGNGSGVSGESRHFTALGVVAAAGIDHLHNIAKTSFLPDDFFQGPVKAGSSGMRS